MRDHQPSKAAAQASSQQADVPSADLTPWGFPRLRTCPVCEYSLAGLPAPHHCPECGFAYDEFACEWAMERRFRARLIRRWFLTLLLAVGMQVFVVLLARTVAVVISLEEFLFTTTWLLVGINAVFAFALLWRRKRKRSFVAITSRGIHVKAEFAPGEIIPWKAVLRVRLWRLWFLHTTTLVYGWHALPLSLSLNSILPASKLALQFAYAVEVGRSYYAKVAEKDETRQECQSGPPEKEGAV